MKFNFRKIASVLTSTVMLSSTLALAAAANFPAPYVKGGMADVAVVYGTTAANSDLVAVGDITSYLQAQLAKQTAPSSGGSSSGATASGGDSVNLASSSQKLYVNSSLSAAKTSITSQEMPNLLADGTATDQAGTQYKYTQKITPGGRQVLFTKSGESIDPIPVIDTGSASSNPLYTYTLTLVKALNITDSTNVIGTSTLKVLGKEFVIGANSDGGNLYLYGSGVSESVDEGETKTVTVSGTEHTISLKGSTSTTAATIVVDGVQKSVNKGSSYKFPGEFEVYIKDIYHATKTGTLSSTTLLLGSKSLHIVNNSQIRVGADDTTIQNTYGLIKNSGTGGLLSEFSINQSAKDATGDYVKGGESFSDRVFDGAIKLQFAGLSPKLDDVNREKIVVDTDNSVSVKLTVTTDLSGGKESTIYFGRDGDGVSDTVMTNITLADTNAYKIRVQEGENMSLYDKILVNSGDKGRVLQLTAIGGGTSSTDKTTFQDIITGENFDFTTGVTNTTSRNIDGQTYYVAALATGGTGRSANVTWGAGAAAGSWGTQRTLFPRIKTKNGGWFTIMALTNVSNVTYSLPGVDSLTSYESGISLVNGVQAGGVGIGQTTINNTVGKISYIVNWSANSSAPPENPLVNASGILTGISFDGGVTNCTFSNTTLWSPFQSINIAPEPVVVFQEEKTVTGSGSTNGEVICIPLTREGTTTIQPSVDTPIFSDGLADGDNAASTLATLQSSTTKSQGITLWGTFVERDTSDNNRITLQYPDTQSIADVLFTAPEATVDTSSDGTTSTGTGIKELGSVTVSDSEAASVSDKNLIVVGGSCVNSVAASLLGGALCGADFESKTGVGAGSFLIQTFDRSGGKVATLVAGYNAGDTTNAAKYLTTQKLDVEKAGTKYKGTSATEATMSSEASSAGNATG
ncbi:MAG: hypothetical protein AABW75_02280 [Nanoarchaeota archaeon]